MNEAIRNSELLPEDQSVPPSIKGLANYFIIVAIPCILFAIAAFFIPIAGADTYTRESDYAFMLGLKIFMASFFLIYSVLHLIAGIYLKKGSRKAYIMTMILSFLGLSNLNPLFIPAVIICLKKKNREYFEK